MFNRIQTDDESHFVAVYGRHRIGKTALIREAFDNTFTFQHSGLSDGGLKEQLFAFCSSLKSSGYLIKSRPENWLEAFECLKDVIRSSPDGKKTVFIDELSWMDTPRCDLMSALEYFWNGFASARKDIILVVCASATSWMLSKVVHNRGGLYNRLTEQISLQPFTLKECEEYVKAAGLVLTRSQILQYYMIFGGVPFYWSFLQKGLSLSQNIDKVLFSANAPLRKEFQYLYGSIFRNPEVYLRIIRTLGHRKSGMTREEIIRDSGIRNSGDLSVKLEELESCGFIRKYHAFGLKTKNALYQLIDNFTLFHYSFLEDYPTDECFWSDQINTPAVNTWMGLAFERVCLEHIRQIKIKLGISGVHTEVNSWSCRRDPDKGIFGSRIDLLIVRKDQIINLCEMKYSGSEYSL
ncbi:MAG: ATP-binding protein [Bullifex sp.]